VNREALEELVEMLNRIHDSKLNLSDWTCKTSACVIGHAGCNPWFIQKGFFIEVGEVDPKFKDAGGQQFIGWDAIEAFFDMPFKIAEALFSHTTYDLETSEFSRLEESTQISIQQLANVKARVIARINKLLELMELGAEEEDILIQLDAI